MRLSLFVAVAAALATVVSLLVPLPYGPQPLAGGSVPAPGDLPRCLRLHYVGDMGEALPAEVRLRAARWSSPPVFEADGGPESFRRYNYSFWRLAGPDSIDISWHHSPVIRLPAKGDSLVGRLAWAGVAPVWTLPEPRDYTVIAHPFPCSQFSAPAS